MKLDRHHWALGMLCAMCHKPLVEGDEINLLPAPEHKDMDVPGWLATVHADCSIAYLKKHQP